LLPAFNGAAREGKEANRFLFCGRIMAITKGWIINQVNMLSMERDKAKAAVDELKTVLEKKQAEYDEAADALNVAFELLDRLDDCIAGLETELDSMDGAG